MIFQRAGSSLGGCFSTILCFVGALFLISALVRGCNSPYSRGERLRDSNPCQAAQLFSEGIKLDEKGSARSVVALSELDSDCAMRQIVRLLDLPDGRHLGKNSRKMLFESLKRRAQKISTQIPDYDPAGSLDTRRSQQQEWHEWLDKHNIKR